MSEQKSKASSSRRARRGRRVQGSKATASSKVMNAAANLWQSFLQPRAIPKVSRKSTRGSSKATPIKVFNNPQGLAGYQQSVVAGVGSSLTHTFKYSHYSKGKTAGVKCSGVTPVAFGYWTSGTAGFYTLATGGGSTRIIPLNPFAMFPPSSNELNLMSSMTRFKFTRLKLIYQSHVSSNTTGNFYFGYYPDGAVQSADITSTFMLAQPGTISAQCWATGIGTDVTQFLDSSTWFYVDQDTATDSGLRLCEQGALTGIWGITPATSNVSYGLFYIDYEVDLIEPRSNSDLALMASSNKDFYLRREIIHMRAKREKEEITRLVDEEKKRRSADAELKSSSIVSEFSDAKSRVVGRFGEGKVAIEDAIYIIKPSQDILGDFKVFQANPAAIAVGSTLDVKITNDVKSPVPAFINPDGNVPVVAVESPLAVVIDDQPIEVTVIPDPFHALRPSGVMDSKTKK